MIPHIRTAFKYWSEDYKWYVPALRGATARPAAKGVPAKGSETPGRSTVTCARRPVRPRTAGALRAAERRRRRAPAPAPAGRTSPSKVTPSAGPEPHLSAYKAAAVSLQGSGLCGDDPGKASGSPGPADVTAPRRAQPQGAGAFGTRRAGAGKVLDSGLGLWSECRRPLGGCWNFLFPSV